MKLRLISIGTIKEPFAKEWINEYLKRFTKYCNLEFLEIKESNKKQEGEELLKRIKDNDFVVVLDMAGKQLSSEELSEVIKREIMQKNISFIIGGPEGLSEEVISKAHLKLSFSRMTFTHQMIRLFLIEQIYRAFTIIKGEKYHK
ncbi:23S rRNA (pseudouridine(1915)-N(3))-methyltransferase RlmH [Candidatus Woesearchaeota archaeon]|nr:23S rRNA (pseudouridine(1915)-N(3))-methyltransferase RlmH [Candidatus Woesearchaeota archaeon]